ncbi:D-alanyl-D-alanine carboxypeptidase family protein [Sphingoaurantiacus capsulatus]|uniref:D-alanyl-D-alanine carboxypeptidase family protein n=1 Tax=Sphingoaurantiacus capsulatus TaxID=1771310 RepID=A0ABV7X7V4_9SPHN
MRSFTQKLALAAALIALPAMALVPAAPAVAKSLYEQPKYAAILVDAKTGEVLYSRRPDAARHPASITKVMTLYLTFEALEQGELTLRDKITFSARAAGQAPSKLPTRKGDTITVEQAIRALTVKSANDVAVALAEKLGVTEAAFAEKMTEKARYLGMKNTRFVNASGLPNPNHSTTARDIAILSLATLQHFPQYYKYYSEPEFTYANQVMTSHNRLLKNMPGADGIKTGYTAAAGFTLAASAQRDGKRLIAVVLGGPSTMARDQNVQALLEAGFDVMKSRAVGMRTTVASYMSEPPEVPGFELPPGIEQGSTDAASPRR